MMRRVIKIVALSMGILLILMVVFLTVVYFRNRALTRDWLAAPSDRGALVEFGGKKTYVSIAGQGTPSVVIIGGLGASSAEWWRIQDRLAPVTKVVTYDRPGFGWSDVGKRPRSSRSIAEELKSLLDAVHIDGPVILLGESIGGLHAECFARLFPAQTAGVVMVEPINKGFPLFKERLEKALYQNLVHKTPRLELARIMARTGLIRALRALPFRNVPEDVQSTLLNAYSTDKVYETMLAEYDRDLEQSIEETLHAGSFPQIPLLLIRHSKEALRKELLFYRISYDDAEMLESLMMEMDRETVSASSLGRIISSKKSKWDIHMTEPNLVVRTVRELL